MSISLPFAEFLQGAYYAAERSAHRQPQLRESEPIAQHHGPDHTLGSIFLWVVAPLVFYCERKLP